MNFIPAGARAISSMAGASNSASLSRVIGVIRASAKRGKGVVTLSSTRHTIRKDMHAFHSGAEVNKSYLLANVNSAALDLSIYEDISSANQYQAE